MPNDVGDLAEPADLPAALDADPAARQNWDAFPRSARRAILEWIGNAKTGTTRSTPDRTSRTRRRQQHPGQPMEQAREILAERQA
jgi:uncharacterized protein YdeI (YjbR/CyaY-like superfamily)